MFLYKKPVLPSSSIGTKQTRVHQQPKVNHLCELGSFLDQKRVSSSKTRFVGAKMNQIELGPILVFLLRSKAQTQVSAKSPPEQNL